MIDLARCEVGDLLRWTGNRHWICFDTNPGGEVEENCVPHVAIIQELRAKPGDQHIQLFHFHYNKASVGWPLGREIREWELVREEDLT